MTRLRESQIKTGGKNCLSSSWESGACDGILGAPIGACRYSHLIGAMQTTS